MTGSTLIMTGSTLRRVSGPAAVSRACPGATHGAGMDVRKTARPRLLGSPRVGEPPIIMSRKPLSPNWAGRGTHAPPSLTGGSR